MHLIIERSVLAKAVGHVQAAAERRNAIPILAHILLDAEADQLTLTATNMDVTLVESVACSVQAPGSVTVSAQLLHEIVSKLPDGVEVSLQLDPETARLGLEAGRASFTLATLAKEDFPLISADAMPVQFAVPGTTLKRLLDKTLKCVAREETRYYLTGVFLHAADSPEGQVLAAVSTDGHRLARAQADLPPGAEALEGLILPAKTCGELVRLLDQFEGDVQFAASDTKVHLVLGAIQLISKVVDGTFPDYRQVIPTQNDKILHIDRLTFRAALDRVSTVVADRARRVKLSLAPQILTVSATSPEQGNALESIEADYEQEALETGFNARYLIDLIAQVEGDWVRLAFSDGSKPTLIGDTADPHVLYVLMPMRL